MRQESGVRDGGAGWHGDRFRDQDKARECRWMGTRLVSESAEGVRGRRNLSPKPRDSTITTLGYYERAEKTIVIV